MGKWMHSISFIYAFKPIMIPKQAWQQTLQVDMVCEYTCIYMQMNGYARVCVCRNAFLNHTEYISGTFNTEY
jgi:hypothetical protein